jgi:hypothetical protein
MQGDFRSGNVFGVPIALRTAALPVASPLRLA